VKTNKLSRKQYQPFIKWVGGQKRLIGADFTIFTKQFNNYYETFVGGGALFFESISRGLLRNKKVVLSDINSEL